MTQQSHKGQPVEAHSKLNFNVDLNDPSACVAWLRERYMKNQRDQLLEEALLAILDTDKQGMLTAKPQRFGLVKETRGVLVTGNTGDGKTALIRRNLTRQPGIGLTDGIEPGQALYIRVPAEATLKGVATDILTQTGYHNVNSKWRTSEVWNMAVNRLATLGITVLWIDEAHHMLEIKKEVAPVLRRLKSLMQGDRGLALIVSGIQVLDDKVRTDGETDGRFERVCLGPIRTDQDRRDIRQFIDLCCSFVKLVPPSDLHLVERLEFATRGSMGRSIEFSHAAMGRALRRGDGQLRLDDFRRSYDLKRGFSDDGPFDPEAWPELKDILEKKGWSV
ncbi:TniB family NTP-binding protein [Sulfitobacter sp. SH24]|uniref:TniB family NTP-binding protein n=1 Tax=Sulfitobacter sp. SH24 TaxID=3421173 RepID=UPI003F509247